MQRNTPGLLNTISVIELRERLATVGVNSRINRPMASIKNQTRVKIRVLARFALVALPYSVLASLSVVWIAALYFYKDAPVAPHAKWGIPALFFFATMMHLRGGKS